MTALLIKESVNQTMDNMGFYTSPRHASPFMLNHSHWPSVMMTASPRRARGRITAWQDAPPIVRAAKTKVRE